jgi:hypothetical protein
VCTKVSDYCKTWDNTSGKCLSCYGGFSLSSGICRIA